MNKICTSIEQSKKLIELGIDVNTADMFWDLLDGDEPDEKIPNCCWDRFDITISEFIPAWSLAALLNILPQSITKYIKGESCQKTFHLNLFRSYYYCCSYSFSPSISNDGGNNTLYCIGRDNWVDACYEMIIKLNELNLL